jgi:hypothetical protein
MCDALYLVPIVIFPLIVARYLNKRVGLLPDVAAGDVYLRCTVSRDRPRNALQGL